MVENLEPTTNISTTSTTFSTTSQKEKHINEVTPGLFDALFDDVRYKNEGDYRIVLQNTNGIKESMSLTPTTILQCEPSKKQELITSAYLKQKDHGIKMNICMIFPWSINTYGAHLPKHMERPAEKIKINTININQAVSCDSSK